MATGGVDMNGARLDNACRAARPEVWTWTGRQSDNVPAAPDEPAARTRRSRGRWRVCVAVGAAAWAAGVLLEAAPAGAAGRRLLCEGDDMLTGAEIERRVKDREAPDSIIETIETAHAVDFEEAEMEFQDVLALVRAGVPETVLEAMAAWRPFSERRRFRDCEECGCMVVVPAAPEGFRMGSPTTEDGRDDDEGPQHTVTIAKPFAVGIHEVTVGEFRRFVEATARQLGEDCRIWNGQKLQYELEQDRDWENPGFDQEDDHPVVCVSWHDAQKYTAWLSEVTRNEYWLLSEAQWEYVARAGTKTARYWGETAAEQYKYANGADTENRWRREGRFGNAVVGNDGARYTHPVGRYPPNGFGLRDVLGNAAEWTAGCYERSLEDTPVDGAARTDPRDCPRVRRGGGFGHPIRALRSASRGTTGADGRYYNLGFRVGRTID